MKLKKYLALVFLFYIFLAPTSVLAQVQDSNKLPQYNSGVDQSISAYLCTPTGDGQDLAKCINRLYKFGITAGAVVLVFMIVIAGYIYITSGEAGKVKAKNYVMNSLVGVGILLTSYVLLSFINPNLVYIKSIQPPIFSATEFPSCEDIGFGQSCELYDEESKNLTSSGAVVLSSAQIASLQSKFESDYKSIGVIPKSEWGGVIPTKPLNANSKIQFVAIHHTGGSSDTPKSIEQFHMSKWSDIGYHFIIDKNGKIYQGRYGGTGVIGAHFHGLNSGNIGVVVIGNYNEETLSQASKDSLVKLLKRIKELNTISYTGKTNITKANITVNNLAAHLEVNGYDNFSTECPGKNLLAFIRTLPSTLGEVKLDNSDILAINSLSDE